jgi:hypothetical protein
MYVWRQLSALRDYADGLLCVIATSKAEAIEIAADAVFARDRPTLLAELARHAASNDEDVYEVIERGAAILRGSC